MKTQKPGPAHQREQEQQRQALLSGERRLITLTELGVVTGRKETSLRHHRERGNFGGAWNGKLFNLDHPDAKAFLETGPRPHRKAVDVPCGHCGRQLQRTPSRLEQSKARLQFCDRNCMGEHRKTLRPIFCPHCGKQFKPKEAARTFCSPTCAAESQAASAPKHEAFGLRFTLKELSEASGLSKATILDRVRSGETFEEALTRPKHGPWRRGGHTEEAKARIREGQANRRARLEQGEG